MRDRQLEQLVAHLQIFALTPLIRSEETTGQKLPGLCQMARHAKALHLQASRLVAEHLISQASARAQSCCAVGRAADQTVATGSEGPPSMLPVGSASGVETPAGSGDAFDGSRRLNALVAAAEHLISTQYSLSALSLTVVSAKLDVSKAHLCRVLRSRRGRTFQQLLCEARLYAAAEILRLSTTPVKTISYDVGYKRLSHFCRDFKKMFGDTPTGYRINSR
jgi:AraC-like DNA-binding protein